MKKLKNQADYEPLNIKVHRDLKEKIRLASKRNYRSMQGQVLYYLEEGLKKAPSVSLPSSSRK